MARISALALCFLALVGCKREAVVIPEEIRGMWQGCIDQNPWSVQFAVHITREEMKSATALFYSRECTGNQALLTGERAIPSVVETGTRTDLTAYLFTARGREFWARPVNGYGAFLNSLSACGKTDWQDTATTSLIGISADYDPTYCLPIFLKNIGRDVDFVFAIVNDRLCLAADEESVDSGLVCFDRVTQ